MKISKEYGPQYDNKNGTIDNLQLVKRYVITDNDSVMISARQGRFTYATENEAEELRQAILTVNSSDIFKNGLQVECWWCYPNHFDPIGKVSC